MAPSPDEEVTALAPSNSSFGSPVLTEMITRSQLIYKY